MSEQTIPIPGRLKNVAIGGHVAGSEDIDAGEGKTQKQVNDETNDTLALHQSEISGLNSQNYVSVSSYSSLPATGSADTIYRVSSWDGNANSGEGAADVTKYTQYAWNGTAYIVISVKTQIGEVFDISEYKAIGGTLAKFADLSAALDNGNNVPAGVRKGGMSVKFVQSSDNKYVQYRLMSASFNTTPANWQGVDDTPIAGSDNLVKSGGVAALFAAGYLYAGTVTPWSDFTTPNQKIFYIANPGTYSYFQNKTISIVGVIWYDTEWHIEDINGDISFDSSICTNTGGYIAADGTVQPGLENNVYSDYIPLNGIKKIVITASDSTVANWGFAFYSSNNESSFISSIGYAGQDHQEYNVPQNAMYFRMSAYVPYLEAVVIFNYNSIVDRMSVAEIDIDGLKEEVAQIVDDYSLEQCPNSGALISVETGGLITGTSNYRYSDFIPISNNQRLYISVSGAESYPATWGLAFYSSDNESSFISGIGYKNDDEQQYPIPLAANYFRFSNLTDSWFSCGLKVITPSLGERVAVLENNKPYVFVAKDGTGDFTTIEDAIASIPLGGKINILLGEGEYDEVNILWGKYSSVNIQGVARDKCIIINKTGKYDNAPILINGNFHFDNLTFKMTTENAGGWYPDPSHDDYGGYALHIEGESYDPTHEAFGLITNCVFYSEAFPAVGMGVRVNQRVEFRDCEFIRNVLDSHFEIAQWEGAFLFHSSNVENQTNMKLSLINCICRSNTQKSCQINMYIGGEVTSRNTAFLAVNNVFICQGVIGGVDYQPYVSTLDVASHGNSDAAMNAY